MTEHISHTGAVRLKLVGINGKDRVKFESILVIAERRLEAFWQIVDTKDTDFYLLGYRLKSQMEQNSMLSSLPRKKCIFYVTQETGSEDNELIIGNDGLPSLRSMVLLFNVLSAQFAVPDEPAQAVEKKPVATLNDSRISPKVFTYQKPSDSIAAPVQPASPSPIENTYFDPDSGFAGLLLSGKTIIYHFSLEIEGKSANLFVNLIDHKYYSTFKLEALKPFFVGDVKPVPEVITAIVLQNEISAQALKQQPLSHLIWYTVFSQSQGRVRKGHSESDIVYLKRWPDINLPGCRKLIKLAAYMQSNAAELSVAQKKTGFSIQQIHNFYNACHAIGLVEQSQQLDIHDKNLNNEKRDLFSQIGKRLGQIIKS